MPELKWREIKTSRLTEILRDFSCQNALSKTFRSCGGSIYFVPCVDPLRLSGQIPTSTFFQRLLLQVAFAATIKSVLSKKWPEWKLIDCFSTRWPFFSHYRTTLQLERGHTEAITVPGTIIRLLSLSLAPKHKVLFPGKSDVVSVKNVYVAIHRGKNILFAKKKKHFVSLLTVMTLSNLVPGF